MSLLSTLLNGLSLGSVYAIIALGYTMVYGIAKMLNFAHGDVIMIGAYISFSAIFYWGLHPVLGFLLAMLVCTVLGIVIESLAYKPLRQATSLAVLITAIGMSYLLQNSAQLIWGANPKAFPKMISLPDASLFGGAVTISNNTISMLNDQLKISGNMVVTILACVAIMICLTLFINKTKLGKAMRGVSEDRGAAELMGINVNMTISLTFAIGSALAAVAGVLLCSAYPSLQPTTGAMPGIKAFTAAVFGGIGSIPGAMVGGILLGVIEKLGQTYVSDQLGDAFAFAVLIIVLLVKPAGLMGKKVHEKV
ncbi:MAG: branched-chain amino acid ABC transporter permease [Clostridia bacterium]|nr:branched-chain amino acid ABC transporter permease [Clostridia bacterium]